MNNSRYDTAQVCLNGHVITSCINLYPDAGSAFCVECGAATISECPTCGQPVRGSQHTSGMELYDEVYEVPAFCPCCGHPYPWTEKRLTAARSIAEALPDLTGEEKGLLVRDMDDLVRDTPATPLAVSRFKKILVKIGGEAAAVLKSVLINVITETAKNAIWPD